MCLPCCCLSFASIAIKSKIDGLMVIVNVVLCLSVRVCVQTCQALAVPWQCPAAGYLSIAFAARPGAMAPADALLGVVQPDGGGSVRTYHITVRSWISTRVLKAYTYAAWHCLLAMHCQLRAYRCITLSPQVRNDAYCMCNSHQACMCHQRSHSVF